MFNTLCNCTLLNCICCQVKLQRSSLDKDQAGQDDPEDMITVDAVGCFDEDDEEGMTEGDDCDSDSLSDSDSQVCQYAARTTCNSSFRHV